ncbi:MAG: hypothetical protein ACE5FH_04990 [Candidatus Zixiibacteriota bacterium]
MTLFLCGALATYSLFTYAALALEGQNMGAVFAVYGLLPLFVVKLYTLAAQIVFVVGLSLATLVLMLGMLAVSAIEMETLRGHRFFSARGAIRFALSRFKQIALSEIAIIAFVAFIWLLLFLFGLICRIPVVGDWLFTILAVIPNFVVGMFTVFILFVLSVSWLLLPAVAAAERHGEVFGAIVETFSTIIRQPVRWLVFTAYSFAAAKVCSFIYAYFAFRSMQFVTWSGKIGGGEKIETLVRSGLSHIPVNSDVVQATFNLFPGVDFGFSLLHYTRGGNNSAAGHFMALMLFLIFASVIAYALSVLATAQARGYVVVRYIKDNHRIPDEEPMFFTDEHVNPPIDSGGGTPAAES